MNVTCRSIRWLFNSTWCGGHLGVLYELAVLEGKTERRLNSHSTLKSWEKTSQTARSCACREEGSGTWLRWFVNQSRRSSDSDNQPLQSFLVMWKRSGCCVKYLHFLITITVVTTRFFLIGISILYHDKPSNSWWESVDFYLHVIFIAEHHAWFVDSDY